MKEIPEQVIQQQAVQWFHNKYCLNHHIPSLIIHSVPNGIPIPIPPKERARALDLLHKTGMLNGIGDLIIHGVIGRCIMPECKTLSGKQSEAQIKIQKKVEALGGVYFLFRSLEEFKNNVEKYIGWLTNENIQLCK
jgi:hypothetical protein